MSLEKSANKLSDAELKHKGKRELDESGKQTHAKGLVSGKTPSGQGNPK